MKKNTIQKFRFTIPIIKTSVLVVKDEKGNDVEERYVEGIASGTELDKHGDRMAPSAIESMAKSLKQHVIALNSEHDTSWLGELGDIAHLGVSKDDDLEIKAKLNEMSSSNDLWYALTKQNKKLGLSIGGYVKDYEMVKEGKGEDAKWVRLYKKIDLDHIAVTSRPAYPKSWVSNIAKSISDDDKSLLKKVKSKKVKKGARTAQKEKERKLRQFATRIVRSLQDMEADLLLELAYAGLQFCDKEQLLLIERILPMKKQDVSLEAKKAKKKADAKVKSEDEKAENLAAPENESSEDESEEKEEAKEKGKEGKEKSDASKSDSKESKDSKEKSKDESDDESEGKDEGKKNSEKEEADESDDSESEDKEKDEESEKSSKKSEKKEGSGKLLKAMKTVEKAMKKILKSNETLAKRVKELESQPADRKTIEVHKELGDDDNANFGSPEEATKKRDKEIAKVRKSSVNDPQLFAKIQKVRAKYAPYTSE